MKKRTFTLLFLLALTPFVSAQYFGGYFFGTEQVIDSLVRNIEPFLRALFGGYDWTGYLLFEKTLLFLLITIIVSLVLGNVPVFADRNKGIRRLVAVIVGVLGVRNLNYIWVGTILVQYQVLFIAVAGILPFMFYWAFVKGLDGWLRKAAWVFYAVIYFGLWATTDLETYSSVYLWGALAALVYGFFLDTYVVQWLRTQDMKKQFSRHTWNQIAEINEKIAKINKQIADGVHPNPNGASQQIRDLLRHRDVLARGRTVI